MPRLSFFNGLLAFAVGRFYAVSIGAAMKDGNAVNGLDECRKWFNTALLLHTVIPSILVVIGYPIGVWAVERFLTVPPDRVRACIWVWRFTCASCFVGMFNVPFGAMYGAKQEIAELTIYGFATTTINAFFQYYMVTHPGVWLVKYSLFTCALGILPSLIISVRAVMKLRRGDWNTPLLFSARGRGVKQGVQRRGGDPQKHVGSLSNRGEEVRHLSLLERRPRR